MSITKIGLRQNRVAQSLILRKPFIKSNQFKVVRFCKCSQIGIGPDVCRKRTKLGKSTKTATIPICRLHPSCGSRVMDMRIKGECQPEVNVRKVHSKYASTPQCLHLQEFREFVHLSSLCIQVPKCEPGEIQLVSGSLKHESRALTRPVQLQQSLQAMRHLHRSPPHRFEPVLKFPSLNCRTLSARSQVLREGAGI